MGSSTSTYVLDANVLIDFQGVDLKVFSLAAEYLGYVLVSTQVIIDEHLAGILVLGVERLLRRRRCD